jgi:hyperosmotically inducible periplasmic protein
MKVNAVIVAASLLVAGVSGCAVSSGQSSVGEYVDDSALTTSVKTKLAEDKTVSAGRISVETLKGVVQLSGFATSTAEKQRAVEIARNTKGVRSVQDSIQVQPAPAK